MRFFGKTCLIALFVLSLSLAPSLIVAQHSDTPGDANTIETTPTDNPAGTAVEPVEPKPSNAAEELQPPGESGTAPTPEAAPVAGTAPAHETTPAHETPTTHTETPPHETPTAHEAAHGDVATGETHGSEAAHGEEHGEDHGAAKMTLIFSTFNFVLFVGLLFFILRKPVANFIRQRSTDIADEIEESEKILADAQKRHEEIKARLDAVDAEISELKEQMRKDGEVQGERIVNKSAQMVEKIREDAKFQAEQQVKIARQELQDEAARLAVKTAEEILKNSVNDDDHNKLVGQFLQEVKES